MTRLKGGYAYFCLLFTVDLDNCSCKTCQTLLFAGLGIRSVVFCRAGNSLIWYLGESLVFCSKMSEWVICSKKWAIHSFAHFWWAKWAIRSHCSFPLSDLSKLLMVAHFWWAKWMISSHRSFDFSEMSNSLTSLTKKEEMSKNERFAHFFEFFFF